MSPLEQRLALAFWVRVIIAAVGAAGIVIRGLKRKSLAPSGAVAGAFVGFLTLFASMREGFVLLAFFLSSSALTRYGAERKAKIEDAHREGGQRDWIQVLANGFSGTVLAVLMSFVVGLDDPATGSFSAPPLCVSMLGSAFALDASVSWMRTALAGAFIGHYACCNGDTWSSELGILSTLPPRLVTQPWRTVPRGTNGGVSSLGLKAAAGGGLLIGLTFWVCTVAFPALSRCEVKLVKSPVPQWPIVPIGAFAGLFGSVVDSLLGATIQYSGFDKRQLGEKRVVETPSQHTTRISGMAIIGNHSVNFLAALITSCATAALCVAVF